MFLISLLQTIAVLQRQQVAEAFSAVLLYETPVRKAFENGGSSAETVKAKPLKMTVYPMEIGVITQTK